MSDIIPSRSLKCMPGYHIFIPYFYFFNYDPVDKCCHFVFRAQSPTPIVISPLSDRGRHPGSQVCEHSCRGRNHCEDLAMNLNMSSCVVSAPWHMSPPYRDDGMSLSGGYPSLSPAVSPFSGSSPYNGYIRDGDVSPSMTSQLMDGLGSPSRMQDPTSCPIIERKSFTNLDTYKCSQETSHYPGPPPQMGYYSYTTVGPQYTGSSPADVPMLSPTPPGLNSPVGYPHNSCMYNPWRSTMPSESPPHGSPLSCNLSPTNLTTSGPYHMGASHLGTNSTTMTSHQAPIASSLNQNHHLHYPIKSK